MKIITQRQLIQNVANKWRAKCEPFTNDAPLFSVRNGINTGKTKKEIAEELDALDKDKASAQDVAAIIGNESWTRLKCNECGSEPEAVLRVGEEPDYESQTACLCKTCVKAAAAQWCNASDHLPRP